MTGKYIITFLTLVVVHVMMGRTLTQMPSLHSVQLPMRWRRLLFVIDVDSHFISIGAIVWQIVVWLTVLYALVTIFLFEFYTFVALLVKVSVCEYFFIGIPLMIYAGISWIILKRKRKIRYRGTKHWRRTR